MKTLPFVPYVVNTNSARKVEITEEAGVESTHRPSKALRENPIDYKASLSGSEAIGVARGCSGCTCTPQGGENFVRPNLQEKCVSAPPGHEVHPQPEQESILG